MKLKTILAASTLAAAGTVGAMSGSASAICGVQLELHNLSANDVTVDFADSDVRQQPPGAPAPGPWTTLGNFTTTIAGGDTINAGFFVPGNCNNVGRQYRLEVSQNGVPSYVLFPGPGLPLTTDRTPHIHVA
jgi:hypothetical protein